MYNIEIKSAAVSPEPLLSGWFWHQSMSLEFSARYSGHSSTSGIRSYHSQCKTVSPIVTVTSPLLGPGQYGALKVFLGCLLVEVGGLRNGSSLVRDDVLSPFFSWPFAAGSFLAPCVTTPLLHNYGGMRGINLFPPPEPWKNIRITAILLVWNIVNKCFSFNLIYLIDPN